MIRVRFNKNKQWVDFHFKDEPRAFRRRYKCDAWYIDREGRLQRAGLFGSIFLPTVTEPTPYFHELVEHEVEHLMLDWIVCRKVKNLWKYLERNNERIATMRGEIARKFWRAYERNQRHR